MTKNKEIKPLDSFCLTNKQQKPLELNPFNILYTDEIEAEIKNILLTIPANKSKGSISIKDLEKALYVVHVILDKNKKEFNIYKQSMYVNISTEILRRIMNSKKVHTILTLLKDNKIIDCHRAFVIGEYSRSYRINSKFNIDDVKTKELVNRAILKKLNKNVLVDEFDSNSSISNSTLNNKLKYSLSLINLNYDEAIERITNMYNNNEMISLKGKDQVFNKNQFNHYESQINILKSEIDNNRFRLTVSKKTHRINTALTNFPSILRKYLTIDNKAIYCLDLKNSQPLFFNLLIDKYIKLKKVNKINNPDLFSQYDNYKSLTESGDFYDFLISKCNCNQVARGKFKIDFFKEVFFSKPNSFKYGKIKNTFIQHFGELYTIIEHYKLGGYKRFSVELQKLESDMFINNICTSLFAQKNHINFFTVHDAIYCTNADIVLVFKTIKAEFNKVGLTPSIDVKKVV